MDRRPELVLKNVTFPNGRIADITMGNGLVTHIGAGRPCDGVIDCTGFVVLPGATDIHVHMRGNSQSGKEDWVSGSRSALAGGVTLVVDQPNTIPPLTTPAVFSDRVKDASRHSACHFAVNSAVTGEMDPAPMWRAGAMAFGETFYGPSSYAEAVSRATLQRSLLVVHALGGIVTIHAESITAGPDDNLAEHSKIRPPAGEVAAIRTVSSLNRNGCRIHFCHLSTAAAINAVSGASVEVTPHHLLLSHELFNGPDDAYGKVNPPLRSEKERAALWSQWDRIDIIASDHAPHTAVEKQAPFGKAPAGIPGVETMMPLLVAKVLERKIPVASLIQKTSITPAAVMDIPAAGFAVGNRADFALYPKVPVKIRVDRLHSRCNWTPYEGMRAVFPVTVIMGGTVIYHHGDYSPGNPRWFTGKGYHNNRSL